MEIPKIVITGGPCAGKTTGLLYLQKDMTELGFLPIIIPEAATILYLSGIKPNHIGGFLEFDRQLLKMKIWQENLFYNLAKIAALKGEKPILLLDRGIMDGMAYNDSDEFMGLLKDEGLSTPSTLERYDMVIHLRSVAFGAENFYTTLNNKARQEQTILEAREKDERVLKCWSGHKEQIIIGNETDLEDKMKKLVSVIYKKVIDLYK